MDAELLANLYVQLAQLHRSLRVEDVVRAIEESLINLIGTEDFALFLRDGRSGRYEPLLQVGRGTAMTGFADGEGVCGAVARDGVGAFGGALTAVALKSGLGERTVGVVVVAQLLAHRGQVGPREQALLEAVAAHAGVALEAALCADAAGVPSCEVAALRDRLRRSGHLGGAS